MPAGMSWRSCSRPGNVVGDRRRRPARYLLELVERQASNVQALGQLNELALEKADLADAEVWEKRLQDLEGPDGSLWKFAKARRLLAMAKDSAAAEYQQAKQLQAEIQTAAPSSPDTYLLRREIAEHAAAWDRAVEAYETAIGLGERRVAVYERLIRLLYDARRFAEAESYLAGLGEEGTSSEGLSVLEMAVAAEQGQLDRALSLARDRAARQSDDAMSHVAFGQMLWRTEKRAEAEVGIPPGCGTRPR